MNGVTIADDSIDLRRGIDYVGVTVTAIIHDGLGNILLMKRGPKARDEHGNWDICGGALEFGESIISAIRREVMEELCVEPLEIQYINTGDAHRINHEGKNTHWIWLLHGVLVDPKVVKIGEPHKIAEIGWFNSSNLPSPLHSQFHNALEGAKKAKIIR